LPNIDMHQLQRLFLYAYEFINYVDDWIYIKHIYEFIHKKDKEVKFYEDYKIFNDYLIIDYNDFFFFICISLTFLLLLLQKTDFNNL